MFTVTVKTPDDKFDLLCDKATKLSDVLVRLQLHMPMPCAGRGTCGKCEIYAEGALSGVTDAEMQLLGEQKIGAGIRLSCMAEAIDNCIIYFNTQKNTIQGVSEGIMPKMKIDGGDGMGVSVDIGTTTIAAYLYSLKSGDLLAAVCEENEQTAFGADVISRIQYSNDGGLDTLSNTIRRQLNDIIKYKFNAEPNRLVITGNTTMLHLFAGLDPRSIAVSPFKALSLFGEWYDNMYLPRCADAYVGADITCAVLASGMMSDNTSLLVDIGTNGEMALVNDGKLICCSTAAGPAFEGALISQGMTATAGAICKVSCDGGVVQYETLENAPACGICGSGLIDAVACMLKLGVIDETGYMEDTFYIGNSSVGITIKDVRQLQLAKSAIMSGIETLISECGVGFDEIEKFYIAGGFGKHIDVNNAAAIGLIPKQLINKAVMLGNAAGVGASMILLSDDMLHESEKIAKAAQIVGLSDSAVFMDKYIENMTF